MTTTASNRSIGLYCPTFSLGALFDIAPDSLLIRPRKISCGVVKKIFSGDIVSVRGNETAKKSRRHQKVLWSHGIRKSADVLMGQEKVTEKQHKQRRAYFSSLSPVSVYPVTISSKNQGQGHSIVNRSVSGTSDVEVDLWLFAVRSSVPFSWEEGTETFTTWFRGFAVLFMSLLVCVCRDRKGNINRGRGNQTRTSQGSLLP